MFFTQGLQRPDLRENLLNRTKFRFDIKTLLYHPAIVKFFFLS
ncbi:Hypothetical protein GbCGDNIH9_8273 [Granulibacter bethesdensis]|uniref:Uncharacterized protein n=1 Tax=Granulibacter bethesdensis TaxID=364410 RepID=A0AAC9P9B8_9PROT|nr:Hypothetical protein GbCGDNIH9_8273 [Granulibacter bethesdensis]APH62460.1 Hypothetical protein GbCGDNIH8_8590 [Granulibacter bethesdensis]